MNDQVQVQRTQDPDHKRGGVGVGRAGVENRRIDVLIGGSRFGRPGPSSEAIQTLSQGLKTR